MIPRFRDFNLLHDSSFQAGILLTWLFIFLFIQKVSCALL